MTNVNNNTTTSFNTFLKNIENAAKKENKEEEINNQSLDIISGQNKSSYKLTDDTYKNNLNNTAQNIIDKYAGSDTKFSKTEFKTKILMY